MQATFTNKENYNEPILIVLKEFDLFAMHPKQTLLYNLFDLVATKRNPIAIVGLSCRWDAIELLEKRVRSRFSNRQLSLTLPENFSQFSFVVSKTLQLPEDFPDQAFAAEYQTRLDVTFYCFFCSFKLLGFIRLPVFCESVEGVSHYT